MHYIYQQPDWPHFQWDQEKLFPLLVAIRHQQGRLLGKMESLGFHWREEASLQTLTLDVVKSSEIEGEKLDAEQVRSSIAQRLGIAHVALLPSDRHVDGVVDMLLDATRSYRHPLTKARLFGWHSGLFPSEHSYLHPIKVGAWRDDASGPMQVISGPIGREKIHFEAPPAHEVDAEMEMFLAWFNQDQAIDPVIKAAIAHIWFITIHPFEDGNGRIARAIADLMLARSENSAQRFYSLSAQIRLEREFYYDTLERTQKGSLDISKALIWFLECLGRAMNAAEQALVGVLRKAKFWEALAGESINARQRLILNRLLDSFEGKLTSSKWAKIAKCSQDTALRDITDLVNRSILIRDEGGGRNTSYSLPDAKRPSL